MAYFDFPLEKLKTYLPDRNEQVDFDIFWQKTLTETRSFPLNAVFVPIDFGLKTVDVYDVTFCGYQGQAVKGWFLIPHETESPLPCVVEFIGYGGGRSFPYEVSLTIGWSGVVAVTPTSSWILADKAPTKNMAIRPILKPLHPILKPQDL